MSGRNRRIVLVDTAPCGRPGSMSRYGRLVAEGLKPERAALEASLIKATFTGLAMDLFATGDTRRLTKALDSWLSRLDKDLCTTDDLERR